MAVARPTFSPSRCNAATGTNVDTLQLDDNEDLTWTPLITCPADFPIALVRSSLRPMHCLFARRPAHSLVQSLPVLTRRFTAHPSSRVQLHAHPPSEVIQDSIVGFPDLVPALRNLHPIRNIHRKLLPLRTHATQPSTVRSSPSSVPLSRFDICSAWVDQRASRDLRKEWMQQSLQSSIRPAGED